MSKSASSERCQFCDQIVDRAAVTRHLSLCSQPEAARLSPGPSVHIVIEGRHAKAYWMHVAVPVGATLAKLDATTSPDGGALPFNHPLLCHPE
jgi:hypothetical protein